MLRLRRYRILLFAAAFITILVVRFSRNKQWAAGSSTTVEEFRTFSHTRPLDDSDESDHHGGSESSSQSSRIVIDVESLAHADDSEEVPKSTEGKNLSPPPAKSNKNAPSQGKPADDPPDPASRDDIELVDEIHSIPPSRVEPIPFLGSPLPPPIRVQKHREHFAVPPGSVIQLPKGDPVSIPKIQSTFSIETPENKEKREKRQSEVKMQFSRAWTGYKTHAWMHDEVAPLSGIYRDPFCGWGATLVDSLDTLWIMGFEEEFEAAVQAVSEIDFSTSTRPDIPVFETTIRYLGGLIAAYDISGMKYKTLLDKAVELAEILISAFDTPNRMPILFYQWKPDFASQPHRASTSVVVAELGSLSMEFTRLAQLTKRHKYYDAIARITNNLADLQDRTSIPGLFPQNLDASGCNRTATDLNRKGSSSMVAEEYDAKGYRAPMPEPPREPNKNRFLNTLDDLELRITPGEPSKGQLKKIERPPNLSKRQEQEPEPEPQPEPEPEPQPELEPEQMHLRRTNETVGKRTIERTKWDCVPQGLDAASSKIQSFSMGGGQDSTYEYLSKQYLLLGGREDQYRKMYLKAMDAVREHLIYRPMVPDGRDILFSGVVYPDLNTKDFKFEPTTTHLTCFIGGMLGMGAKIFDLKDDLEIAKKLTDGCVWAYESTVAGVMPESGQVVPCKSQTECSWDESLWWRWIDPLADSRAEEIIKYNAKKAELESKLEETEKLEAKLQETKLQEQKVQEGKLQELNPQNENRLRSAELAGNETDISPEQRAIDDVDVDSPPPISTRYEEKLIAERSGTLKGPASLKGPLLRDSSPIEQVIPNTTPQEVTRQDEVKINLEQIEDPSGFALRQKLKDTEAELTSDLPVRNGAPLPEAVDADTVEDPLPPMSHEEFVSDTILLQGLTPGWTAINDPKYILRPEAIESVFYMYRITGDPLWQEKGWTMFEHIIHATRAPYGHSAIFEVTKKVPDLRDEMESFWMAETLKYFYLLFAEPDVVSLDEWVLNTEAHPFRRGD